MAKTAYRVQRIDCEDEVTEYKTVLDCVFVGNPRKLTNSERKKTVDGIETVYNKLQAEKVCDSLQRRVVSVSAPIRKRVNKNVADPSEGGFVLSYEVTGSCRGCPEPLLFEDSINRNQSPRRALKFTRS
ncbi:hypothetical protein ACHAWO_001081 [Cyclotella atomus]|uniref:Uncharacterized protein n=1 Tax=Cyclotella atomus TaxID=382360 RepID=A0ABD3PJ26_9STRA